ncbi:DUF1206 domain-containing protein [Actinopolymorpha sp. B11F2]|uniref:DUF1206 domain-containing protein n=1 Tax=Actinopolymorpha sp. B11F2 TaxID=3160862 RepID=UPI0032E49C1D
MNTAAEAEDATRRAARSSSVRLLGRIGIIAYGLVHLLIAFLAVKVATGEAGSGAKTDKSGALQALASQPGGPFILWAVVVGLSSLALWQVAEAVWGYRGTRSRTTRIRKRLTSVGEAVVFGVLAYTAGKVATSGHSSSGVDTTVTAQVLALPYGPLLVGTVGAAVVVIAVFLVHRGLTRRFTEDLDLSGTGPVARKVAVRLGQIGYPALGVAYGTLGGLVIVAAVTHDPAKPLGLDAALQTLAGQPYGRVLLGLVAAGLACFGTYCLYDARYRRD